MNTAWAMVTSRLDSRLAIARLDPWTSELVGRLIEAGALRLERAGQPLVLLDAARAAYRHWAQTAGDLAVDADRVVAQVVAECTPRGTGDALRVTAARDWAALLLLERIDEHSLPLPRALMRLARPSTVPAADRESVAPAASWWAGRAA